MIFGTKVLGAFNFFLYQLYLHDVEVFWGDVIMRGLLVDNQL